MNLTPKRIARMGLFILFSVAFSMSCSDKSRSGGETQSVTGSPDQVPLDTKSVEAQLRRYIGQKEFLNVAIQMPVFAQASKGEASDSASGGTRQIEEGDLFKVGKAGSKILYVLNPYRGLQVIDFSKGPEFPRLLGRTDASSGELLEMYFDENHMTIVVLERTYDYRSGAKGFLQVYSVEDPARPSLIQTVELNGDIADSRVVGNVLYVGSSRWQTFQGDVPEAWIQSFNLAVGGVSPIASYRLTLPIQSSGNMNIVETEHEGQLKYYLIATLAQNRFDWRDRQSTIEVIDISDPQGVIRPALIVSAKGEIRERSGSSIKDGSLIAVSNSWSHTDMTSLLRVSVETFALPTKASPTIDQVEADFRRLWFEKKMRERPADVSEEDYANILASDPEYGLKGVFVKDGEQIKKILPDQVLSVGDSTGLHASLQDVRWVGDKLYIFWVPANQIDPLDVFDISQPATNLRYLGRTLFDGWMERAIPIQYKGVDYLLGLGWVVPALNPTNSRHPQALLFRLPATADEKVETVAQLTLQGSNTWAYFNDQDKSIEVRVREDGTGTIIFPAYSWGETYQSGGKLIAFDLNAKAKGILQEGGFLSADANWLRRVFANPELDRMHTLSDRSLSTFDLDEQHFGASDQVFAAISTLELARDVRAYLKTQINKGVYGVQIVDRSSPNIEDSASELRVVDEGFADAEIDQVLAIQTLKGQYQGHFESRDGTLYVLTSRYQSKMLAGGGQTFEQSFEINRLRWTGESLVDVTIDSASWDVRPQDYWGFVKMGLIYRPISVVISEAADGSLLVSYGRQLTQVDVGPSLSARDQQDALACLPKDAEYPEYHHSGNDLYVSYGEPVASDDVKYNDIRLVRNFVAPVSTDSLQAVCSAAINIPGRPLRFESGLLISNEDRFLGLQQGQVSNEATFLQGGNPNWAHTAPALVALQLDSKQAALQDIYGLGMMGTTVQTADAVYVQEQESEWSPRFIVKLSVASGRFEREAFLIPTLETPDAHLVNVLSSDKGRLFVLQNGREGILFRQDGSLLKGVEVRVVKALGELSKPTFHFPLLDWLEPGAPNRLVFDAGAGRLTFAQGLYGLQQVEIVKN